MIRRVERESKRHEIWIDSATCDRCGHELIRVNGVGVDFEFPFRGILVRGNLYAKSGNAAETRRLEAELCDDCADELIAWIGASEPLIDREFTYARLDREVMPDPSPAN